MIDLFMPRPSAATSAAAAVAAAQAGEKVVQRPRTKVLPAEQVDKTAQTGPRPAFQHTYLEQMAAYWPEEPDAPVSEIDVEEPDAEPRPAPELRVAEEAVKTLREEPAPEPTVDVRA